MKDIRIIKLNKFVLYVSAIAIALFVFAYNVGELKAETITLLDDSKSSVLWENAYINNTTKNSASFVATTNNIYSVKALIVSADQYSSYGDSPFYMRVMDSADQIVGETSLTWSSIDQMAGASDWGWCMANGCNDFTEFIFDEPVEITEDETYYFQIFSPYNVHIGRNSNDLFAFYSYYDADFEPVVPDSQTGVWGYLNFQSKYQCNRDDSCVLRFFYNQEYIPEDTNEIRLSYGVYPDITVVATSTIEDFSLIGKSDGRSFISFDIASTTPRGTYEYFVNAEADDDSWVFSAPIYVEVFNEGEYLNPYPEMEEFEMWGSEWYFKLLSIFPFNIPTSFIIAWNNSATAELPKDLEFLDMADVQGNFNASFPKQWLGTPADMEFTLFGYDKIVNGSSRMILLLENFKKFTTFLQWLMFVWGFWGFAKLVIDNLNVSVVESGTENIHSFSSHSQHLNALGRSSRSHSYSTGRSRTTHRSKKIRF